MALNGQVTTNDQTKENEQDDNNTINRNARLAIDY